MVHFFRRRSVRIAVAALMIPVLVIGVYGLSLASTAGLLPWQADPTRIPITPFADIPGFSAPTPTAAQTPTPDVTSPAAETAYQLVSEESLAQYTVAEELVGIGQTEAIGTTNAIVGRIVLGADGAPASGSEIDVDLRTLTSDEARRDNYLRSNTLETDQYPLATFVVTGVEGWPGPLVDGEETTFALLGDLTIHGVTQSMRWEVVATLTGDTLEGTATTEFEMADFAIEPPTAGPVLGLDETIRLELSITAVRAE